MLTSQQKRTALGAAIVLSPAVVLAVVAALIGPGRKPVTLPDHSSVRQIPIIRADLPLKVAPPPQPRRVKTVRVTTMGMSPEAFDRRWKAHTPDRGRASGSIPQWSGAPLPENP